MSLRKKFFAATYDSCSRKIEEAGLRDMRHGLIARGTAGRSSEIGAGTGANLAHYNGHLESLVFTEPEPAMLRRLQAKARDQAPLAKILRAPAEDLPVRGRELRHRRLDARAVRRRRPGAVGPRDPPRPQARWPSAVPRARAVGRSRSRALPGPDELAEPPRRPVRLQPADPLHDRGFGLHRLRARAHRVAEGAEVRQAADLSGPAVAG